MVMIRDDLSVRNATQELLTPEVVAQILRVRARMVYEAARAGKLRSVKVGKFVRFRRQDVDQYIAHVTRGD